MDGPTDYHTKWSKSYRERQIYHSVWNLILKNDTNELIYKTETDLQYRKQTYGYQRGNMVGRDKLGAWDWHIHTTIHKIDNQQGPTV